MKNEFEYKKALLCHPLTVYVGKNNSVFDVVNRKWKFDYYGDAESSATTGFVIEITDILSNDVKTILAEHKIKIGDIIYLEFNENEESWDRARNLKIDAEGMARMILDNKEDYKGLKSTAFMFTKVQPINDYEIGKLEQNVGYYVRDKFLINDSIAKKIVGNIYAIPERVLKRVLHRNNDLGMEM